MYKDVNRVFTRVAISRDIKDPVRCLGLAVIHQAFVDGDTGWLQGGETLPFWCDVAGIDQSYLAGILKNAGDDFHS